MLPDRRAVLAGAALFSSAGAASSPAQATALTVERLAWAGIRLECRNVAVFIDAVAADSSGAPGPVLATSAQRSFALVTHHHGDHCDPLALASVLGPNGYIVAEEAAARLINPHGVIVQSVRTYEPAFLSRGGGEFAAFAVPAVDGLGSPQVSWVVDAGGRRILHCGDTLWHGGWWDIARAYGPFDAAFLPINGMRQSGGRYVEVSQPMSLTPEQAVAAARVLRPRLAVPIHYGARGDPAYLEQENAEARFLAGMSGAGLAARVLRPGETFGL